MIGFIDDNRAAYGPRPGLSQVAQSGVARLEVSDRLGIFQRLEPSFNSFKPRQIEGIMPCHCVVLPEKMRCIVSVRPIIEP
jgi:hypothetical protein